MRKTGLFVVLNPVVLIIAEQYIMVLKTTNKP